MSWHASAFVEIPVVFQHHVYVVEHDAIEFLLEFRRDLFERCVHDASFVEGAVVVLFGDYYAILDRLTLKGVSAQTEHSAVDCTENFSRFIG